MEILIPEKCRTYEEGGYTECQFCVHDEPMLTTTCVLYEREIDFVCKKQEWCKCKKIIVCDSLDSYELEISQEVIESMNESGE